MKQIVPVLATLSILTVTPASSEDGDHHNTEGEKIAPGLIMPDMDAGRGRELFASKGCVVCHSINGTGGEHAPRLDAELMDEVMNPFEFAARMWRGAGAMVSLQKEELGGQIHLTGEELAHIIAFAHDAKEQKKFSMADVPHEIKEMMHHQGKADHHEEGEEDNHD